jgi:hypothetical protein
MTWDVSLWCKQCEQTVGYTHAVQDVTTAGTLPMPPLVPVRHILWVMREHEISEHGGKSE